MKLICGEEEQIYPSRARARRGPYRGGIPKTTVDVARILEAKYELLETFFNVYYDYIIEALTQTFEEELEFEFSGRASATDYSAAEIRIAEIFQEFIESGNAGRVGIPGTPTKAAKKRGGVSFLDTGLFKDNARFWVED